MHFLRTPVLCAVLFTLLNGSLPAQKKKKPGDDEGYVPVILPEGKKKKKDQDVTQTLPPPKELPSAVVADTDRLTFDVSPLQGKGLLSAQTREALRIIGEALEAAGASFADVVRTRVYMKDVSKWEEAGRAHGEVFRDIRPANTIVGVSGFVDAAILVEIEATAIVSD